MNPNANDTTANNPQGRVDANANGQSPNAPSPNAPASPAAAGAAPAAGGLKSTLKIAVPIVALMAVIFGVTFFAQYTPPSGDTESGGAKGKNEPVLRFFTSARHWDPADFSSD